MTFCSIKVSRGGGGKWPANKVGLDLWFIMEGILETLI